MPNLFKKASIITTPTAYEDGVLNSVKPAKTFGSELVTNGTFDTDTDWTKGAAWTINSGTANYNDSSTSPLYQNITLNTNTYQLKFTISNSSGSGASIWIGNSSGSVSYTDNTYQYYTNGNHTLTINVPSNQSTLTFYGNVQGSSFSIDNVSVKEVTDADFDFTRGSSATRVNEKGLVQDVQLLSGELVQNGDFEQIGSEEVTNGGFDNSSSWGMQSSWSISNGSANYNGVSSHYIEQSNVFSANTFYKITFTISNNTSGIISIRDGIATTLVPNTNYTNGTHTLYVKSNTNTTLRIYGVGGSGTLSIDNVSVKEVGQNWTVADDDANNYVEFNQEEGTVRLKFLNTSPITSLKSNTQYLSGKKYKLTVDVKEVVSGAIKIDAAGVSQTYNSVGVQEAIIEPTSGANISFYRATANVDITLNSVSLIEITEDTDLPRINYTNFDYEDVLGDELLNYNNFTYGSGGWSLVGSKWVFDDVTSGYLVIDNFDVEVGQKYQVTVNISISSGDANFRITSGNGQTQLFNYTDFADGETTFETTVTGVDGTIQRLFAVTSLTDNPFTLNSISVKRLTEDVVVPYSGEGSLLLEPQSTNLITYSEDFSQWSSNDVTIESGYLAPDGSNNAYKVTRTGTFAYVVLSGVSAYDNARTIYAKTVSGSGDVKLTSHNQNTNNLFTVTNQWQRFEVNSAPQVGNNFYAIDFRGAGTTLDEVIIWGAQSEALSYATSYIVSNSGSTTTRLADVCNNSGNSDLINSTEGVLYAEISALAENSGLRFISLYNASDTSSRIEIRYNNSTSTMRFTYVSTSNVYLFEDSVSSSQLDNIKLAFVFKTNRFAVYVNGNKLNEQLSGNANASGIDTLDFDQFTAAFPFFGNVKCVAVFKEALSDDELACLTS